MCPIPVDVIAKSCQQVEDLFNQFLKISISEDSLPKKQASESNEVHYESLSYGLQRDSAKRLSSPNNKILCPVNPRTRGTPLMDQNSHDTDILLNRRSLEFEPYDVPSSQTPTAPCAPTSGLQRDSRQFSQREERMEVESFEPPRRRSPPSPFEEHRVRSLSQGPTELQLHEAAVIIAGVGDQIEKQYGGKMREVKAALTQFIQTADQTLSYETFAVHINNLVGDDRDWTNFMFMMHLSRRVLIETSNIGKSVSNYFRRYLGAAFAEQVAQRNNVVEFVTEQPSSL